MSDDEATPDQVSEHDEPAAKELPEEVRENLEEVAPLPPAVPGPGPRPPR